VQRLRRLGYEVDRFHWGSGLVDDVPPWPGRLVATVVPLVLGAQRVGDRRRRHGGRPLGERVTAESMAWPLPGIVGNRR
jgi:hypothetical protein